MYRFVPVTALPFPHSMGGDFRLERCPFSREAMKARLRRDPGVADYARLYSDQQMCELAKACSRHRGDWHATMPVLAEFLRTVPDPTDESTIRQLLLEFPRYRDLSQDDRHLACALLGRATDPVRVHQGRSGMYANGQHRICAARIAGVHAIPVWITADTPDSIKDVALDPLDAPGGDIAESSRI
jgi:hypothetical protein